MANPALYLSSMLLFVLTATREGCGGAPVKNDRELRSSGNETGKKQTGTPVSRLYVEMYPGSRDTAVVGTYLDGEKDGTWKKYYPGGVLREKREFVKGRKTGVFTAWWENRNKQLEYLFENDEYQGTCREWNRDGMLVKEMNYENGYETGSQKMFYDNGKIRSNYVVKEGRRYGLLGTKNCTNVSDSVF